MKKNKFFTLLAIFIFLFTLVGCKKEPEKGEKGDPGIQGIQGIQGVQGIQGEKGDTGVGIASTVIEDNYIVITYTDGTVEKIHLTEIKYEKVKLELLIYSEEQYYTKTVEAIKDSNLIESITEEVKDQLGDYCIEEIYYNGNLVNNETTANESGQVFVNLISPDSVIEYNVATENLNNEINKLYGASFPYFDVLYNNSLIEIYEAYDKAIFYNDFLQIILNHTKIVQDVLNEYKTAAKIEVLRELSHEHAYLDSESAIKMKENIQNVFSEINNVESLDEMITNIDRWKAFIYDSTEYTLAEDSDFVTQKVTLIKTIMNALRNYFIEGEINRYNAEFINNFYVNYAEAIFAQSIEEVNQALEDIFAVELGINNCNLDKLVYYELMKREYEYIELVEKMGLVTNINEIKQACGVDLLKELYEFLINRIYIENTHLEIYYMFMAEYDKYCEFSDEETCSLLETVMNDYINETFKNLEVKYYTEEEFIQLLSLREGLIERFNEVVENEDFINAAYNVKQELYSNDNLSESDLEIALIMFDEANTLEELDEFNLNYQVIKTIRNDEKYDGYNLEYAVKEYLFDQVDFEVKAFFNQEKLLFHKALIDNVSNYYYYVEDIVENKVLESYNYNEYVSNKEELVIESIKKYVKFTLSDLYNEIEYNEILETINNAASIEEVETIILSTKYLLLSNYYHDEFTDAYIELMYAIRDLDDLNAAQKLSEEELLVLDYANDIYLEGYYYNIEFKKFSYELEEEGYKVFSLEEQNSIISRINDSVVKAKEVIANHNETTTV